MIQLVHIDDDLSTLTAVRAICERIPQITYLEGFRDPLAGLHYVNENKDVNLLLLDIEMPEYDGFDVFSKLQNPDLPVIFLSNHSGYVTRAFDACALHYLLKPVTEELILKGVKRYFEQKAERIKGVQAEQVKEVELQYLSPSSVPKRLFINHLSKITILKLEEVMYLVSSANYTCFYMSTGQHHVSSKNIKVYEEALQNHPDFIRIHRSHMVNKGYVTTIKKHHNRSSVIMTDERELDISRAKNDEIIKALLI